MNFCIFPAKIAIDEYGAYVYTIASSSSLIPNLRARLYRASQPIWGERSHSQKLLKISGIFGYDYRNCGGPLAKNKQ